MYAKLIEGEVALQEKDPRTAIQLFNEANKLMDTWIGRFDLGRAYLEAGLFVEADSEFDRCIKRRGETLDLFDYVSTYGYSTRGLLLSGACARRIEESRGRRFLSDLHEHSRKSGRGPTASRSATPP